MRPVCRPGGPYFDQQSCYTGYKKGHFLRWQGIIAPCGLFVSLHGPCEGRQNDRFQWNLSQMETNIRELIFGGELFCLYGDSAYPTSLHSRSPYSNPARNSSEAEVNSDMARLRISVEWGFKDITNTFRSLLFTPQQNINLTLPALQYAVAVLLHNCRVCMNGNGFGANPTAKYFACPPPSIQSYLGGARWE